MCRPPPAPCGAGKRARGAPPGRSSEARPPRGPRGDARPALPRSHSRAGTRAARAAAARAPARGDRDPRPPTLRESCTPRASSQAERTTRSRRVTAPLSPGWIVAATKQRKERCASDHEQRLRQAGARHAPPGWPRTSATARSSSPRSTRTPTSTRRGTSRARSSCTGGRTCRIRSSGTWSTRRRSSACSADRGIGNDTTVVLYGDKNNWFAAYAYWYLKVYGHGDVRILDGGRQKWIDEGRELTTRGAIRRRRRRYSAQERDESIRAYRDQVREWVESGEVSLVDVRSPGEYAGELIAPPGYEQEGAQRGRAHPDRRLDSRGRAPSTTTARSSRPTSCASSTAARASRPRSP